MASVPIIEIFIATARKEIMLSDNINSMLVFVKK
jgi:hypothetical protein